MGLIQKIFKKRLGMGLALGLLALVASQVTILHAASPKPAPFHLAVQTERESPKGIAILVPIRGQISKGTLHLVRRGVREALSLKAKAIIFEIDSPGGEVTLMDEINDAMHAGADEGMESVAFVVQNANSAAAFLAIGCDTLFMHPASQIGSAMPIQIDPFGGGLPEGVDEKMLSAFRASFRRQAETQGRNVSIAESMVDRNIELLLVDVAGVPEVMRRFDYDQLSTGNAEIIRIVSPSGQLVNLTAGEALELNFIDGIVSNRQEMATALELDSEGFHVIEPSWSEGLASFLDTIGWALFLAGCVFLFVEFQHPGFGAPGIIGAACFALLLFGKHIAGLAELPEILLVVFGLIFIAGELFIFPGTLFLGITGGVALLVGILLSFQSFIFPQEAWQVDQLKSNVISMTAMVVAALFGAFFLARLIPRAPGLNRMVLAPSKAYSGSAVFVDDVHRNAKVNVGDRGVAQGSLRPAGHVEIENQVFDAVAEGSFIEGGREVRVIKVHGNRIVVEEPRT